MDNISELKIDYDRKRRMKENLEKNFERRKKLNLVDPAYERQIISDIKELESEMACIERKVRSIQSEKARKKLINNK
ncbi:MAG: hypothetical protein PHP82_01960 [Candidatus ainarchaeum sp.]|nr:hypothetical protein [Candidatus ainarchaeum sp.]